MLPFFEWGSAMEACSRVWSEPRSCARVHTPCLHLLGCGCFLMCLCSFVCVRALTCSLQTGAREDVYCQYQLGVNDKGRWSSAFEVPFAGLRVCSLLVCVCVCVALLRRHHGSEDPVLQQRRRLHRLLASGHRADDEPHRQLLLLPDLQLPRQGDGQIMRWKRCRLLRLTVDLFRNRLLVLHRHGVPD